RPLLEGSPVARLALQRVGGVHVETLASIHGPIHWGSGGSRLTAMITRGPFRRYRDSPNFGTTLTPWTVPSPSIRIVRRGVAPPCTIREGEQQRTDMPQRQPRRIGACFVANGRRLEHRTL